MMKVSPFLIGLFLSLFAAIGIATMAFSAWSACMAHQSETWPAVYGKIILAECGSTVSVTEGSSVRQVLYEYVVNGKVYRNDREYFGMANASHPCVTGYTASQNILVSYDPGNPQNSTLIKGQVKENMLGLMAGVLFLAFAGLAYYQIKKEKKNKKKDSVPT